MTRKILKGDYWLYRDSVWRIYSDNTTLHDETLLEMISPGTIEPPYKTNIYYVKTSALLDKKGSWKPITADDAALYTLSNA